MVPGKLYLDTARLGRMSVWARRVVRDFAGFAGEVGLPLYGEEFLRDGYSVLPLNARIQFPALATWSGIANLKSALRQLVGCRSDARAFVANRSRELMRFAIGELLARSQSILTTDLDWLPYRRLLHECRNGDPIKVVSIRDSILHDHAPACEIIHRIVTAYCKGKCDGLYLTAVSHDGVRLPIDGIVREIKRRQPIKMVVVDGAQDFCHVPPAIDVESFDLYVAGCHKWLRAYQPMGVMIAAHARSRDALASELVRQLEHGEIDDPLLQFTQQIEQDRVDGRTETVNLMPIFSCAGAVAEALSCRELSRHQFHDQLTNAAAIAELAQSAGWCPMLPEVAFRSGIVLLETPPVPTAKRTARQLQAIFDESRISMTAYESGQIRLSMPKWPLSEADFDQLRNALRRAA